MRVIEGLDQGTESWYDFRLKHLTATDSVVLSGKSPWRTPYNLWIEKVTGETKIIDNKDIRRGKALEPYARERFTILTGIDVEPTVIESAEHPWAAASLDGLSYDQGVVVEIKVHGKEIYNKTLNGYIPEYYIPQFQKQLFCSQLDWLYYFPFDGENGHAVKIYRDDVYIKNMIALEKEFWDKVCSLTPPETCDKDFLEINDDFFVEKANKYRELKKMLEKLTHEELVLKNELCDYAHNGNVKGGGIKIQRIVRRGNVDYQSIPQLQDVDLNQFRKSPTEFWQIRETA